ncbi:acyltransferase [Granulicella sp. WH15]|uniref:acyltransferase family protein n=1 Tax=Granulicella sp. WH15 TaxID=2602070 RepID=UPI0013A54351|nr:acyltransferase [Granulicella sp. WH15]
MKATSSASPDTSHVFLTLDALRGVAAIAVMTFHYSGEFGHQFFPHGYLAVDFFFMLSGFVLTFAYQTKLDRGWTTRSFLVTRLVRLYPLYFIGLVLGIFLNTMHDHSSHLHPGARTISILILDGLLLLPAVGVPTRDHIIFPYNQPAWSLFFEVAANIFHALFLRRRSWKFLLGTLGVVAMAFIYSIRKFGTIDFGVSQPHAFYTFSRVLFSYLIGMLLLMVWKSGKVRLRVHPFFVAILLLLSLGAPAMPQFKTMYDLLLVVLFFPVLLLVGASSQPGPRLVKLCHWLGISSYAVYMLHVPCSRLLDGVRHSLARSSDNQHPWASIISILFTIMLALLLDRFYDIPVRTFLRRKLASTTASPRITTTIAS